MKVEPLGHRILIDPNYEDREIKKGGLAGFIITADENSYEREKEATQIGRVVAIGENAWRPEGLGGGKHWCEVGDIIYFAKFAQKRVVIDDKEYFVINDEDCQLKLTLEDGETFEDVRDQLIAGRKSLSKRN